MNPTDVRGRFRFLLGEMVLGTWRPTLTKIAANDGATGEPLADPEILEALRTCRSSGLWVEQAGAERFSVGIVRGDTWTRYVPRKERLYYVKLEGTFDDYLGKRSSKSRYNLKRSIRLLEQANTDPILEVFTAPEDMARFQGIAAGISRQTYQAKVLHVGFGDTPEFLAELVSSAERGEARGYLLHDKGTAIAFAWCSAKGRRVTYNTIGYLPDRASASPGTVLLTLIVRDLFALGRYDMFDFGVGESFYKSAFATDYIDYVDAYFFQRTMRNWLLVQAHWHLENFSSRVGAWLERRGLKKLVKSFIRQMHGARGRSGQDGTGDAHATKDAEPQRDSLGKHE